MKNSPRIAIPLPHSSNLEYAERAIPQYERAVAMAGGEPVRIPLDRPLTEVSQLIESCQGALLPGSNADVDPARFHAPRSSHTAAADPARDAVDSLLLDDAYRQRKAVLGICYGLQSLNVYRGGSLIQHIPDFLPQATRDKVNHEAGKEVVVAHTVEIDQNSNLARVAANGRGRSVNDHGREGHGLSRAESAHENDRALAPEAGTLVLPVNSSHHQSAERIGDGLRIVALCPDDSIIEALEGTSPDHFVLAVQWHPERSIDQDDHSRAIFRALIDAASKLR